MFKCPAKIGMPALVHVPVLQTDTCPVSVQVTGVAVSPRHPYMFSCGLDKMVKCWDLETNKVRAPALAAFHLLRDSYPGLPTPPVHACVLSHQLSCLYCTVALDLLCCEGLSVNEPQFFWVSICHFAY